MDTHLLINKNMNICNCCGRIAHHFAKSGKHWCENNVSRCPGIKERKRQASLKKYGVDNPSKATSTKDKIGVANRELSKSALIKRKETCLNKYGVNNVMQVAEHVDALSDAKQNRSDEENVVTNNKRADTNLAKYGYRSQLQRPEIKQKVLATKLEKYGPLRNGYGSDAYKSGMEDAYGVTNPSHSKELIEKITKGQYRTKEYTFPSGRLAIVQGYENRAIDQLLETYDEDDIVTDTMQIPRIPYTDNTGKNRYYFPDIFIPKDNLIIEVKSAYTYNIDKDTNLRKEAATIAAGYQFQFSIFD